MPLTQATETDPLVAGFLQPPKTFSPVPIWWWSGERLDRRRLRWQLERFAEGGIFNLIVLNLAPTSPLYGSDPDDPHFLSEAWWEIFLGMCEDARELGIHIWFYDQLGFSGANFQGQVVSAEGRFAGQWLESTVYEGIDAVELVCPAEGIPLAAAVTLLDEAGQPSAPPQPIPVVEGRALSEGGQRRRVRLAYAVRRGFDYFSVEGCADLLNRVHGEFERRAAHLFGEVIVGSFQDELPSLASWGADFARSFVTQKGYDLLPHLVDLWDGRGPAADQLRHDFHQVRATLAEIAFFQPLFAWHERHQLLCGFDQQGPARAGHPIATVRLYADYLRTHRWFTVPGSDHHGDAKIHSSLAHLYHRPRVWIEAFHSSGWGGTLEETFDWLLPWLRAGATLYNPHAVYYSTRGGWWEWAPPSTCWRQPYWRHHAHFAQAVSRLCFVLSQGEHCCDIGLLFPTTTVQGGLLPDGSALPAAQAAHTHYQQLVGSMFWQAMQPGILDRDRRDYDVLDDGSLQRGIVQKGTLSIGAERYRALILLGSCTLESASASLLCHFVEEGGLLIAVGNLPEGDGAVQKLRQAFADGRARHIDQATELPAALADLPRTVDAPVPTLHRRVDGRDVLFVPAAFPYATRQESDRSWLDVAYSFDPADYALTMTVTVRGVQGSPELWDVHTGTRRLLAAQPIPEGVVVDLPFDAGPAALLVWPNSPQPLLPLPAPPQQAQPLSGPWEVTLEPTLDNRYGDLARPAHPGSPPVQSWRFAHRCEAEGEDGIAAGWQQGGWSSDSLVQATFGPQGWFTGPLPASHLPPPLATPASNGDRLPGADWQPVTYSLTRGVLRDPLHLPTLGPKGHVPEEFLVFGRVAAGQGVQFRTGVWLDEDCELTLALGAPAAKELWVNGSLVDTTSAGYLAQAPVTLRPGFNLIEFRLTAEQTLHLRASWALLRAPERYARPEWMTTPDAPLLHSSVRFLYTLHLPFEPVQAILQIGSDAPCCVLVNGVEIGRQGGFDPYHSTARVQPYPIHTLHSGSNQIEIVAQDMGQPAAVVADGLATGSDGQQLTWSSGPEWQVQREHAPAGPVRLRRRQWADTRFDFVGDLFVEMDPSFSHLWRRPHPLPGAAWLEESPADDTVLAIAPDPFAGSTQVEWLAWRVPPGAHTLQLPVQGSARLWIDGVEILVDPSGTATLPENTGASRQAALRVEPALGCSQGRLLAGPIVYTVGQGQMEPGLWASQGLDSYAGGVRYRRTLHLAERPTSDRWIDLGRVRGSAELWINGQPAGVRVLSPYRFRVTELLRVGDNLLEILVFNTLAPYLEVQSPTFYIFPGQCDSGLIGPVSLIG